MESKSTVILIDNREILFKKNLLVDVEKVSRLESNLIIVTTG